MTNLTKIIFILVFISFCFLFFGNLVLAQELEEIYPQVPRAERPTTVKTLLPEYIKYIFNLAIIVAGLAAFISLIYGGFRYIASTGNSAALADARGQIGAGIFGLLLLLSAYLILFQINPQLVVLKIGKAEFEKGVILYADPSGPQTAIGACNAQRANPQGEEGKDFLRVKTSLSWLGDPDSGGFSDKAGAIYFYDSSEELEVKIFPQRNYKGNPWESTDHSRDTCKPMPGQPPIPGQTKSIQLFWKMPGVYLFTDKDCKENPRLFVANMSNFVGFHDEVRSIKIVPRTETVMECNPACSFDDCLNLPACQTETTKVVDKFGAILHEHSDFHGDVEVFFDGLPNQALFRCIALDDEGGLGNGQGEICVNNVLTSYCREAVGKEASAITLFLQRPQGLATGGVTLYSNYEFNEEGGGEANVECGPFPRPSEPQFRTMPQWIRIASACDMHGTKVSSIRVEGDFIAVLFREDGRGEVFTESDIRLKDNHIGDDKSRLMLVVPTIKTEL